MTIKQIMATLVPCQVELTAEEQADLALAAARLETFLDGLAEANSGATWTKCLECESPWPQWSYLEVFTACPFCGTAPGTTASSAPGPAAATASAAGPVPACGSEPGPSIEPEDGAIQVLGPDSPEGIRARVAAMTDAERTAEVRRLYTNIRVAGWELGQVLAATSEGDLWRDSGHDSFQAWYQAQGLSKTMVHSLIRCVNDFDRDTFVQIGRTKIEVIYGAPPEIQHQLIDAALQGASRRELESQVETHRGENGAGADTRSDAGSGADAEPPPDVPPEPYVSVVARVLVDEHFSVPLRRAETGHEVKDAIAGKDLGKFFIELGVGTRAVLQLGFSTDARGRVMGLTGVWREARDED